MGKRASQKSVLSLDPADEAEEVERILRLDPKDRSTINITLLNKFFDNNRFFK